MIDPKELRIGSYVIYEKTTHIITGLLKDTCTSEWVDESDDPYIRKYSQIEPIPITEDWLIKFGFEKSPGYWIVPNISFFFGLSVKKGLMYLFDSEMTTPHKIEYIHQIQNAVSSITGKELTIKK